MALDSGTSLDAETERAVESFVADWMADADVPGAAVAVVDAGGVRYAEGFGARDLSCNAPATPDTLFGIGSCTKSFTATALLRLVERGDVSLDDAPSEYVDRYADAPGDPVTLHELLTHSSGYPSDAMAVALIQRAMGVDPSEVPLSSEADFRRYVAGATDERVTDRETFFYYNSGYTVLGEVVEAVTGQSFSEAVRELVLDPLGMERSTFDGEAFAADDDRMTPYYPGDDGSEEGNFPFDRHVEAPGGLVCSVTELATYLRAHLRGGEVDGTRLLDADTVEEMHRHHSTRQTRIDGVDQGYGYGWMVEEFLGDRMVAHGGSVGVSTAWQGFLEDAGLGVVVLCNTTADPHPMHVGPALLAILEGQAPERVEPHYALAAKCESLPGEYESYKGLMTGEVARQAGGLKLELGNDRATQTLALHPDSLDPDEKTFHAVGADGAEIPVRFERHSGDADGGEDAHWDLFVQRWRLHGD
jgi:CubicO group peptidase (beta-lactamase class C family)